MNYINDLVSIIVPIYNTERYLETCLNSIISQTYKNLEIILVNDCSTDKSGIICNKFSKKDKRVKVIHKKSGEGCSKARNSGLNIAQGEFILFVDSDDYISRKLVEICIENYKKTETDLIIFPYIKFDNGFENIDTETHEVRTKKMNREFLFEEMFKGHNGKQLFRGLCWNKMYKMDYFNNIRFPENRKYGEDTFVTYEVIKKINNAIYLMNEPLYFYRNTDNSALNKVITLDNLTIFDTYNDILRDVKYHQYTNIDYIIYAYIIRFYEFTSKMKNEINNEYIYDYLFMLKQRIQLNYIDVLKNPYINISLKLLFILFIINIKVFKIIYWKI